MPEQVDPMAGVPVEPAGAGPSSHPEIERVLVSEDQLRERIEQIAARVDEDYAGQDLLVVGVLKGAFVLLSDLMRALDAKVPVDFMAVSSYGSATRSSGVVRILKDLDVDIEGRHVLVVEDIVDSGLTLDYLLRNLRSRGPASVEVMALLSKPARHKIEVPVRYVGFEVPDLFVVGYGLDFDERYRGLPYIGTLRADLIPEH